MYAGLALAIMIVSLLVGAWCFVAAGRDRWIDLTHLVALGVLAAALLVQGVIAVVRMIGGERPAEFATFVGYLVVSVLIVPGAVLLAFLERTRWGAIIAGAGAVVAAVLTLRLQQVWQ